MSHTFSLRRPRARRRPDWRFIPFVASLLLLASTLGASFEPNSSTVEQGLVQNAANDAAVAGARAVAGWTDTNSTVTAMPEVLDAVNSIIDWTKPGVSCSYVDDADAHIGDCNGAVPLAATGVAVVVSETHRSLLHWLIPWLPQYVTTEAAATAHVQMVVPDGSTSPFIVCGIDTELAAGGTMSILQSQGGQYLIDPAAYGEMFEIHWRDVADCGLGLSDFKGLADSERNAGKKIGDLFFQLAGDKAIPTPDPVDAPGGCPAAAVDPYNCILIVPIASQASNGQFYVVQFAPFMVTQPLANTDEGVLIARLLMNTPDDPPAWVPGTWARGDDGVFIARLTC